MSKLFSNGNGGSLTFAKFNSKIGAFVIKDDEGKKVPFSQIRDVTVIKLGTRDGEYEGQPYTELVLQLRGKDETAQVSFNVATGACAKFVSILNGADLSKPLGLTAGIMKAGTPFKSATGETVTLENDLSSVSVFQDGYLKPTEPVPAVPRVKVGNKEVPDTSARDAFTLAMIAKLEAKFAPPAASATDAADPDNGFDDADPDKIPF